MASIASRQSPWTSRLPGTRRTLATRPASTTIVGPVPSPVDAYLASVHAAHLPDLRGDVYDQIPELGRRPTPTPSGSACPRSTATSTRSATRARTSRSSRSRRRSPTASRSPTAAARRSTRRSTSSPPARRSTRSALGARDRPPEQRDDQRGRDRRRLAGRRRDARRALRARALGVLALRRTASWTIDEDVFRVRPRDRPPQPRDRPPAAQLGRHRDRPRPGRSTSTSASARCSVDCRDLALMAATLANGGVQPRTGERVFEPERVERVLSVMTTCGMYDAAGEWVVDVGLPAKSGVGGGMLAVLPGQLGIALYSPRLDRHGNSVRGVARLPAISRELELHFLHVASDRRSAIRDAWDVGSAPSQPPPHARRAGGAQRVRRVRARVRAARRPAVRRRRVRRARVHRARAGARGDRARHQPGAEIARSPADVRPDAGGAGGARLPAGARRPRRRARRRTGIEVFDDPDEATAWAEDQLIERHGGTLATTAPIALAEHGLAGDLRPDELGALRPLLERRSVAAGEKIVSAGDDPAGIFFIVSGQATAEVTDPDGTVHRDRGPPGRHELRQARGHLRRAARDRRPRRHGPRPVRAHPGRDARARAALAAHRDRAAAHDVHAAARCARAAGPEEAPLN